MSNEHNRWCTSGYTTDMEIVHVATLKMKDVTIPYCNRKKFQSLRYVLRITVNIRHPRTQ
jgi:hypothetical protein